MTSLQVNDDVKREAGLLLYHMDIFNPYQNEEDFIDNLLMNLAFICSSEHVFCEETKKLALSLSNRLEENNKNAFVIKQSCSFLANKKDYLLNLRYNHRL